MTFFVIKNSLAEVTPSTIITSDSYEIIRMNLTKSFFDNLDNKQFQLQIGEEEYLDLNLVEIKSIKSETIPNGQIEPFSLLFQSTDKRVFEQNTFLIKSDSTDDIHLFLVPIGANERGTQYEAIFT
jgi:hypothetical protein